MDDSRALAALVAACLLSTPVAAAQDERGPALANPLGGLLLEQLSATRERPLFVPSRRPPAPPAPPPEVSVVSEAPPQPPAAEPQLSLFGIVGDADGTRAIIRDASSNEIRRLRIGDTVGEWVVAEIGQRELVLRLGDRSARFQLFAPGASRSPAFTSAAKQRPAPQGLFTTPGGTLLPPRNSGRSIASDGL